MLYTIRHTKQQLNQMPLAITLLGIHHLQETIHRPKGFSSFQWFYCEKGSGEIILNQKCSVLNAGQGMLIYPGIGHSYRGLSEDWTVSIVGFEGRYCAQLLQTLSMQESGVYYFYEPEIFTQYVGRIAQIIGITDDVAEPLRHTGKSRGNQIRLSLSKLCYEFLLDLSGSCHYLTPTEQSEDNFIVNQIVSYCEEHLSEPITLDQLADVVHLSKSYMSTIFRKEMGQSVMQFLTQLRISRARILLIRNPTEPVQNIARQCGFESPSYFGKIFKKMTGITPWQYRSVR